MELTTNSRGGRVLRVGQTGNQLVGVMMTIVIAAAIGFVGTDVTSEIDDNIDVDGSPTVTNESVGTVVFTGGSYFYTVSKQGNNEVESFKDNEQVFNTTSDVQLTEATDYEWFPANGTVKVLNTSTTGNNTADTVITYEYVSDEANYENAKNNISGGFADAMSLTDIVFLVLMFGVILTVLVGFRRGRF